MPLDYKILDKYGTSDERLRQLFTADPSKLPQDCSKEDREKCEDDAQMRKRIEQLIASRIDDSILQNLRASHLMAAVDLAWDSSMISRRTIPLVMYAQRRIDMDRCIKELQELKCADQYVKRDKSTGRVIGLDLPKFTEINVNLLRSVIGRRVAAQSARFTNLFPFFKYEPRGTSEADKLRGDLVSQRTDIMADQYGYRGSQVQWIRDMLLYPHCVVFPAAKWHREVEWIDANESMAEEYRSQEPEVRAVVKREGVPMLCPHPSRVFYDMVHPITSINSDSGCEWFGFWDVCRYSEIGDNSDYFNRGVVSYNAESTNWFFTYSSYFSQYYCTIKPPFEEGTLASYNDRKNQVGYYSSAMRDSAVYLTHYYWKVRPNQWRMGDYPHHVWLHLVIANSRTIIGAEIMPDCPGFVFSFNESAQRTVNLSMANELMPFNDQLSNLFSHLLEATKRDMFGVAMLNLDAFPVENPDAKQALDDFRSTMKNENFFASTTVVEVSLIKMRELGIDLENVFKITRPQPNQNLTAIYNAITQVMLMGERVMSLSPQEQAQMAPRETSATEVQIAAAATENMYQFISDAVDEGRAAMKRYLYHALISLGSEFIYLPVVNRYRKDIAQRAGFRIVDEEELAAPGLPQQFSVIGKKHQLQAPYIFNTRDGAERVSNIQSAQTLVQLLGVLMQPAVLAMLQREKLADLINTIVRQSGAGVDITLEPPPGTGSMTLMPDQAMGPTGQSPETETPPGNEPIPMPAAALPTS